MRTRPLTPFGTLVKARLKERKMTQVNLAFEVGTSKQYLDMILHGERSGKKYLNQIAEICNIDLKKEGLI